MSPDQIKTGDQILAICKKLYARNMLAAADGNVSCKISESEIMITPSGKSKSEISPKEMAIVGIDGRVKIGKPSSELKMHLKVYQNCADAKAVVHAHPPTAIAWSIARPDLKKLPAHCLSELILAVGDIPFVPYARPGTQDMGEVLTPFLKDYRAMILSRHGALSWGESLEESLRGMERIEHVSEILFKAHQLGGLTYLPEDEVNHLREMRKNIAPTTL